MLNGVKSPVRIYHGTKKKCEKFEWTTIPCSNSTIAQSHANRDFLLKISYSWSVFKQGFTSTGLFFILVKRMTEQK